MGTTSDSDTDGATAGQRLRLLSEMFREHPVTGPAGHSYVSSEPRATAVVPALPYPSDVVEHIDRSVAEIVQHTRAVNPAAGPLPARVEGVYDWYVKNTRTAPAAEQRRRDTVVYRQQLEHAIAMGEYRVIPPHRCPSCRTFGLMWVQEVEKAVCTNTRCTTKGGRSNMWTLASLAYEHVAVRQDKSVARAT